MGHLAISEKIGYNDEDRKPQQTAQFIRIKDVETIDTFGRALRKLMEEREITQSQMARMMHFHSKNSLVRLINDDVSWEKQEEALRVIREEGLLGLSERELEALHAGVEIRRIGETMYRCNRELERMVMAGVRKAKEKLSFIRFEDGRTMEEPAADTVARWFSGRTAELTISGCPQPELYAVLAERTAKSGAKISIRHIIESHGETLVRTAAAIHPLLFESCYCPVMTEDETLLQEDCQLYANGTLLCRYEDADGTVHHAQYIKTSGSCLHGREDVPADSYAFSMRVLDVHDAHMKPVKGSLPGENGQDYMTYIEQYAQLEADCSLYDIRRDVPINFVPPKIQIDAFRGGLVEAGMVSPEDEEALLAVAYAIEKRRFDHFMNRTQQTYSIFDEQAMHRFAQTGMTSDHFFAMRAYTPEERVAILTNLRRAMTEDEHFHVYFFLPGHRSSADEFGYFEGKGLLVTKAYTDYKLDDGHAEAMITQPEIGVCFKNYFTEKLLRYDVMSEAACLETMDALIAEAEAAQ